MEVISFGFKKIQSTYREFGPLCASPTGFFPNVKEMVDWLETMASKANCSP